MNREPGHPRDQIQDLLDGRLAPGDRIEIETHLDGCDACRRELRRLADVKAAAAAALSGRALPPELAAAAVAALDREDSGDESRFRSPRRVVVPWWMPAGMVVAVAAVLVVALFLPGRRNLPSRVARDYANFKAGILPLAFRTEDPSALEKYFADREVPFPARVYDLGMMKFRLEGGRILNPDGRQRALFVYRGPENEVLACQMFEGDARNLPAAAAIRRRGGVTFLVYRYGGSTQVVWQEGRVICVLVSDIPEEDVVALALAKATPV